MERETTPSQSEWLIMEVLWANDTPSMTAKEVIRKMQEKSDMSPRMVHVLLNRLWQKGVLSYTVDECVCFHSAENGTEKQGIPKGRIMEPVHSCIVCWQDEVFL